MRALIFLILFAPLLAGCADDAPPPQETPEGFEDYAIEAADDRGVILGIVIDESIRPVPDVPVTLPEQGLETRSDAEGRFVFQDLEPGRHTITVEAAGYLPATVETTVEAGIDQPPLVRITLERVFSQSPFTELFSERGFIECSHSALASVYPSNNCIRDYTSLAGGILDGIGPCTNEGCVAALNDVSQDENAFMSGVGPGWQTQIWELTWVPSAAATSSNMGIIVSHENRLNRHAYADVSGQDPLRIQIDTGEKHGTAFGEGDQPATIDPDGRDDLTILVNVRRVQGIIPALALQQDFEVFHTKFYYGLPGKEDWSVVAGDEVPF